MERNTAPREGGRKTGAFSYLARLAGHAALLEKGPWQEHVGCSARRLYAPGEGGESAVAAAAEGLARARRTARRPAAGRRRPVLTWRLVGGARHSRDYWTAGSPDKDRAGAVRL